MGKFIDLSGQVFGRWTVTDQHKRGKVGHTYWLCYCSCGKEKWIAAPHLKSGLSLSCGCYSTELLVKYNKEQKFLHLTGRVFGRWTVASKYRRRKFACGREITYWLCKCSCGHERWVSVSGLTKGKSLSCGCYRNELASVRAIKRCTTHGLTFSPEYSTWRAMLARCHNPKAANYAKYGGKRISVCDRWRHSFENFRADMGPKPSPRLTIDRIDSSKGYYGKNCRWATYTEQSRHRTNTIMVDYLGAEMSLGAAYELAAVGASYGAIRQRIRRWECTFEEAIKIPVLRERRAAK
jgi:hypothetical protein